VLTVSFHQVVVVNVVNGLNWLNWLNCEQWQVEPIEVWRLCWITQHFHW
jgi:hypothetical protein